MSLYWGLECVICKQRTELWVKNEPALAAEVVKNWPHIEALLKTDSIDVSLATGGYGGAIFAFLAEHMRHQNIMLINEHGERQAID